jgi:PIN domain nuclease of toxin-antitoxin system
MAVKTYLADSGKYLVCRVDEPVTEEVVNQMSSQMKELVEMTGVRNRLIDARGMPNLMSVLASYDLAYKDLDAMQMDRATKIAALRLPTTQAGFASTAIKNAGFNLRVFADESEAVAWLEE